ncbi:MAG: CARDB domain-containing protein [Clostridia bacterium]|nr:hypothetical protein [Clostridia bacterium]MBP3503424.1 hypothetical protein [Clostridia bacterium]
MKNKSRVLIVALIVVLLALAIAYASFSGVLNISGKANASGNFEVVFTNGVVSTSEHGTAVVTATDATKMTADIKLSYPGDGCYVTATIKNNGTVPAKLVGFNIYNKGTTTVFSNDDIEVLIPDIDTTGNEVLQAGESCTITFTVKWKKESTKESATAEFDIELDYEQSTDEFTGSASYGKND